MTMGNLYLASICPAIPCLTNNQSGVKPISPEYRFVYSLPPPKKIYQKIRNSRTCK